MSKPNYPELYKEIKDLIYKDQPEHSAYRSGRIVKNYKHFVKKFYGKDAEPYKGKKKKDKGLSRWFKEEWETQSGSKEYEKKGDLFRPSKRVTEDTPTTWDELSKKEIRRARKEKLKKGRVSQF